MRARRYHMAESLQVDVRLGSDLAPGHVCLRGCEIGLTRADASPMIWITYTTAS